jgi:hypothetical protein
MVGEGACGHSRTSVAAVDAVVLCVERDALGKSLGSRYCIGRPGLPSTLALQFLLFSLVAPVIILRKLRSSAALTDAVQCVVCWTNR